MTSLNDRKTYVGYFGADYGDGRSVRGDQEFVLSSRYAARKFEPGVSDFTFGNPHEMPIEGIVSAIRERAIPHNKNWFAYKTNEEDLYLAVSIWPFIAKHEANDYRGAHPAA